MKLKDYYLAEKGFVEENGKVRKLNIPVVAKRKEFGTLTEPSGDTKQKQESRKIIPKNRLTSAKAVGDKAINVVSNRHSFGLNVPNGSESKSLDSVDNQQQQDNKSVCECGKPVWTNGKINANHCEECLKKIDIELKDFINDAWRLKGVEEGRREERKIIDKLRCIGCGCKITNDQMPVCFDCQVSREDANVQEGYDKLMNSIKRFADKTKGDVRIAFDQFIMNEETEGKVKVTKELTP